MRKEGKGSYCCIFASVVGRIRDEPAYRDIMQTWAE